MAVWPSGLRRRIQAPFRKGEGSNPSTVRKTHGVFFCSLLLFPFTSGRKRPGAV